MDFNRALDRNPDYVPAYLERGLTRHKLRAQGGAVADLSKYLENAPNHSGALTARGKARLALGDHAAGVEDLRHALKVDSKNEDASRELAALEARAPGAPPPVAGAAPAIPTEVSRTHAPPSTAAGAEPPKEAAPETPLRPKALPPAQERNARGRQLNAEGKFREAVREFGQAVALDPQFAQAFNSRGYAYIRLGQARQAIADLSRAIELNPVYKNAYQNRAAARRALGDRKGAAADAAKAETLID